MGEPAAAAYVGIIAWHDYDGAPSVTNPLLPQKSVIGKPKHRQGYPGRSKPLRRLLGPEHRGRSYVGTDCRQPNGGRECKCVALVRDDRA